MNIDTEKILELDLETVYKLLCIQMVENQEQKGSFLYIEKGGTLNIQK